MALSLGLHKEFPEWKISLLEREMRRRVWWGVYIFDSGASITFGRPVLLPENSIMDANQVLNIHEEVILPISTWKAILLTCHLEPDPDDDYSTSRDHCPHSLLESQSAGHIPPDNKPTLSSPNFHTSTNLTDSSRSPKTDRRLARHYPKLFPTKPPRPSPT